MSLMKLIENYDWKQREYISYLEERVKQLESEKAESINLAFKGAQERDRSMLKLILSGALKRPEKCEQCANTKPGHTCIACEQQVA